MKAFVLAAMFVVGLALIGFGVSCEETTWQRWCFPCGFAGGFLGANAIIWTVLFTFGIDKVWFGKAPKDGAWKD